jgi:hypothetical protein
VRALLVALAKVIGWSALLWLLAAAATCVWWPIERPQQPIRFDLPDYLQGASASLFVDNVENGVYEMARRCPLPRKKRLVLFGSSGSRGFQPELLANASDAEEVVNLSLVQSNFTQNRQLLHDLQPCLGADGMRSAAYVLIVSFGSFTSNAVRNIGAYSDYETEKLRSHLFAGGPGEVAPILERRWLPPLIELSRPVLAARKLVNLAENAGSAPLASLDQVRSMRLITSHFPELDGAVDEEARFALEQRDELAALASEIRGAGAALVVVEQPAQSWMRNQLHVLGVAHRVLLAFAQQHSLPYLDLSASAGDDEFHDPVHANDVGYQRWGARLADALIDLQRKQPDALGALRLEAATSSATR